MTKRTPIFCTRSGYHWGQYHDKPRTYPQLLKLFTIIFAHRITLDDKKNTCIEYKNWSSDEAWQGTDEADRLNIFKMDGGKEILPEGKPQLVENDFSKILMTDVSKNAEYAVHVL